MQTDTRLRLIIGDFANQNVSQPPLYREMLCVAVGERDTDRSDNLLNMPQKELGIWTKRFFPW